MSAIRPEPSSQDAERQQKVRALRGKYRHLKTSSDDFARRKLIEIQRESGWQDEAPE